jgi:hypothetical protein
MSEGATTQPIGGAPGPQPPPRATPPLTAFAKDTAARFVLARRYLAINLPFLWQIRAHLLVPAVAVFAVMSLLLGLVLPVRPDHVPEFQLVHFLAFLPPALFVCYWLIAYFRVLSPELTPPTLGEPPVVALLAGAALIVLPTYIFLAVAEYRVASTFPDVGRQAQTSDLFDLLWREAGEWEGPLSPLATNRPLPPPYVVEADGTVGPVTDASKRASPFRRRLICDVGNRLFLDMARTSKFTLGPASAPAANGTVTGVLAPPAASPPAARPDALQALYRQYLAAGALTYAIRGPANGAASYCLSVPGSQRSCGPPAITIALDCKSMPDTAVDAIIAAMQTMVRDLASGYPAFAGANGGADILRATFQPFCDVGMKASDCVQAFGPAKQASDFFHTAWSNDDLTDVKIAHGGYLEYAAEASITLQNPGAVPPLEVSFPVASTKKPAGSWTASGAWFIIWLIIFGLLAILVKSFRLLGESATNYLFASLFIIPGILVVFEFFGYFVTFLLARAAQALGFEWSPTIDVDYLLIGSLMILFAYVAWQSLRRSSSKLAIRTASFLLFALVVFTLCIPTLGGIYELDYLPMSLVYLCYFGLVYEACYFLTRRLLLKPH